MHVFLGLGGLLYLVLEVVVALFEVVNTDKSVFAAGCIRSALRADGNVVEGTEMALDTPDLLFENLVVETCFELSLTCAGGGNVTCCLTTTENDKLLERGDARAVERTVSLVVLEHAQRGDVKDVGAGVTRRSDEVRAVWRELQVADVGSVNFDGTFKLVSGSVVLADLAVLVAGNDVTALGGPAGYAGGG